MFKNYSTATAPKENKQDTLTEELKRIKKMINDNEILFNLVDDEHLVEYAIYQHNALFAQYRHIVSMAKLNQTDKSSKNLAKEGSSCR